MFDEVLASPVPGGGSTRNDEPPLRGNLCSGGSRTLQVDPLSQGARYILSERITFRCRSARGLCLALRGTSARRR